ncbi:MAG: bifunctional N(6)-L-threonylcarbamoyladenine synthase/serine/threonine protein kinase [Haloferacaceae archaeon]
MRVLGVEGTAWAASAAVYDAETDAVLLETDAYQPESGGIHPREAAEHMSEAVPGAIEAVLDRAREAYGPDPIDAVAFSRGPGLGPCLRVAGTAARALAGRLDLPLVGVNHMVAHLEIGRHRSGFDAPVCLNASGANAHLLGYRDGRYRMLGETMDTGVGNALDKFARHVGWSHPGGPKVEAAASEGAYVDLPYVVKGLDFSFSGIVSAAQEAYDEGEPVEDVCRGLQESIFGMLTEVSERALSLTGADELVLGGGVGRNDRLREMLAAMCATRGARFHAPEARFLGDNAGMIAVLGAKMYAAGDTISIGESRVDPDFRPDEVPVTWRAGESVSRTPVEAEEVRGAEALVRIEGERVVKTRRPKEYRHSALDERLRRERTRLEARLTSEARREGVPTPVVRDVDVPRARLVFQHVGARDLAAAPTPERARAVGGLLATLHRAGLVHGDPTTRNVRIGDGNGESGGRTEAKRTGTTGTASGRIHLIDFGLGYHSGRVEDHAMDLHVLRGSLAGTVDDAAPLLAAAREGYAAAADDATAVLDRLDEIEGRGRYQ